jgi:hypothetical protein
MTPAMASNPTSPVIPGTTCNLLANLEWIPNGTVLPDAQADVSCAPGEAHQYSGYVALVKSTDGGNSWYEYGRNTFTNTSIPDVIPSVVGMCSGPGSALVKSHVHAGIAGQNAVDAYSDTMNYSTWTC